MNQEKRLCPICGHKDINVMWEDTFANELLENESFCCHHCGFFSEITEVVQGDKEFREGIVINPEIVSLMRQFLVFRRALKKDSKILNGLRVFENFPNNPPKK